MLSPSAGAKINKLFYNIVAAANYLASLVKINFLCQMVISSSCKNIWCSGQSISRARVFQTFVQLNFLS